MLGGLSLIREGVDWSKEESEMRREGGIKKKEEEKRGLETVQQRKGQKDDKLVSSHLIGQKPITLTTGREGI